MRKKLLPLLLSAVLSAPIAPAQPLLEGFQQPPQSARPRVWWHWMDGNVTMEGIQKDLDWMERAGIGGFHQFDAGGGDASPFVDGNLSWGSPLWKTSLQYAMELSRLKGMETAVASAPGWSSTGGPWVKPEDAMKKLTWRTVEVTGPGLQVVRVAPLYDTPGSYQNIPVEGDVTPWCEHLITLAIPLPDAERSMREMGARVSSSGGHFTVDALTDGDFSRAGLLPPGAEGFSWIQYSFDRPETIRSLTLGLSSGERSIWGTHPAECRNRLESSEDGLTWKTVCEIPSASLPVLTMTIPATRARYFRLVVPNPETGTGTGIREFVLHGVVKVNHAEDKAGFAAPYDLSDFPTPPTQDAVRTVQDLSLIDRGGTLVWKVPAGRWRIYRFGASLTGKKNHPAPPEATGLEVDKLDPAAWEDYFKTLFSIYEGMPVDYLLTDSYEAGQMTWTRDMFDQFRERRGYELYNWLPALTGEVLRSSEETERFLFDWRQTLGELFAENYDRLGDLAREAGLKGRYTESHENGHVYVGDGMDLKRSADIPMSAIWMDNAQAGSLEMGRADIRESASVAHIYGQNLVAAESFTTSGWDGKAYSYCPENMKYTADVALSEGLNRFVIHESAHQPSDAYRPGLDLLGYGQWFNRHETWAEEARAWTDYLARSSFLLQQGRYKADILYLYGEDNCITGLFGNALPPIPQGYSYDFIQPSGLQEAVSPLDGTLVTASGMRYRMLVLDPNCASMSLPLLRRVVSFARSGVPVCGTLPVRMASLSGSEEEFRELSDELASLMLSVPLPEALRQKEIQPDFIGPADWAYVHRETEEEDIYWIRNFSGAASTEVVLLQGGKGQPRVLDPVTGKIRRVNASTTDDGYRYFQLKMAGNDALFVVIGKSEEEEVAVLPVREVPLLTLDGPWNLSFDSGMGAPPTAVFDRLQSYTESSHPAIRYYSGTVTYRKEIKLARKHLKGAESFILDLGEVKNLARVTVNGFDLGVAWKEPFRVDIPSDCLHKGINVLEIKVINLWPNRIVGDLQPDATRRWTYTGSQFYTADSPLLPSGLLGPVTLHAVQPVR